jgi:hypothetical protein
LPVGGIELEAMRNFARTWAVNHWAIVP